MASQTKVKQPLPAQAGGLRDCLRVLVLDDDQFDRLRIRRAVKHVAMNVKITEISSIEALVPAMETNEFDLFLVDYLLPRATGLEALKLIKANPTHRFAATIMISGVHEAETAFKTNMAGGDEFVTKNELKAGRMRDAIVHALSVAQVRQALCLGGTKNMNLMPIAIADLPETAVDLRPALARILRQISFLRQVETEDAKYNNQSVRQLEVACRTLWETLAAYDLTPVGTRSVQDFDKS